VKNLYLLIDLDTTSRARQVAESLRHKPYVRFVDPVTGPHDVIAVLDGWDNGGQCFKTLMDIQQTEGVRYVTACYAIRPQFGNGNGTEK
jgi:hypothetical protein